MLLRLEQFGGIAPSTNPFKLADAQAQVADNCRFDYGDVRPWNAPAAVPGVTLGAASLGTLKTIYRFSLQQESKTAHWMQWVNDVSVVKGPFPTDTTERTYWTGDGVPKMGDATSILSGGGNSYPNISYVLGVPRPSAAPSAGTTLVEGTGSGDVQSVAYVYTYVSSRFEEGAISGALFVDAVQAGQSVNLKLDAPLPSGAYDLAYKRLYATATDPDSEIASFYFKGEYPISTEDVTDTAPLDTGSRLLESRYFDMPLPDMHSLIAMANGGMAGLSGMNLCLSELNYPHAWPTKYINGLKWPGVALGLYDQTLVVLTTNYPYLVPMADPQSASPVEVTFPQACVSARSVVTVPGGVVYASPDGLCLIGSGGQQVLTASIFNRAEWQAMNPKSIHAVYHDGHYIAFYDTGTVQSGFVFDPSSATAPFMPLKFFASAAYVDTRNDTLFLVIGGVLHEFGTGAAMTLKWRSKRSQLPRPAAFNSAQVLADGYPVTFRVFSNGALHGAALTVSDNKPFRLHAGLKANDIAVEVEGAYPVKSVFVASSIQELRSA